MAIIETKFFFAIYFKNFCDILLFTSKGSRYNVN